MIAAIVHVHVKSDRINDFIHATKKNHDQSVLEPGNLRFDILQSKDDPCYFTLYEAYQSEESAKAHKETSHYLEWKNSVEPWMAEPRKGVPFSIIAPSDLKGWGK